VTFTFKCMAAPVIETCHIACCANRTPNVLSWGRGGLIAYGTCYSVALYDPLVIYISQLKRVSVSLGSIFGGFVGWVECVGHTGPVCAVDAIHLDNNKLLIASTASDSTVRLWLHTGSKGKTWGLPIPNVNPFAFCYQEHNGGEVLSLQGHEDWIRGVEWTCVDGDLLLASCAQDCLIRVWKLVAKSGAEGDHLDVCTIRMWEDVFTLTESDASSLFAVTLETVLAGHENWVYGVHWQLPVIKGGRPQQSLSLLSASMDKTMILWAPEEGSGVWVEQVRVGEVGGNTLGFYGCQISPDGSMILAHAFHGALHLWARGQQVNWSPGVVISGHFSAVQDLCWDPEGEFVISVGSDQTARLLTPWKRKHQTQVKPSWHEISRPQIHGYDMQCLAMVGRFLYVSGADEKVLRVFRAPRNFVENFANISGAPLESLLVSELPEGASTPALGLSNKAVFQGTSIGDPSGFNGVSDQYRESYFHPLTLTEPPPEDHLLQNTLWPEVQKLYGHGFETFCLASDSQRTVVASACKASKAEHAAVLLWSATCWRQLQALPCHSLTVTQMSFSPDGRFLLAVSRDRTWSLWRRDSLPDTEPHFSLFTHTGKDTAVHTRIIWSCDWTSDSKFFVTSSRDRKVIVWGECSRPSDCPDEGPGIQPCSSILDVKESATAVSVCPFLCPDLSYLLAVGLDSGRILLYKWTPSGGSIGAEAADWSRYGETDVSQSHTLTVKRLRWRPRVGRAGQRDDGVGERAPADDVWVQLASAGADNSVRIFSVNREAA
uniref:Elongator complex protein 2 n=1 Tax=Esox lucius TaxID=8010 RepID=A0AAY5JY47_ESOLU